MSKKILSIDDSKMVHIVVKKTLSSFGVDIVTATNGEEGISVAQAEKPDLILLDATMPVMDGLTALAKLKENEDTKEIPVVMLSADACQDNKKRAKELGALNFINKPFTSDTLLDGLKGIIELQAA